MKKSCLPVLILCFIYVMFVSSLAPQAEAQVFSKFKPVESIPAGKAVFYIYWLSPGSNHPRPNPGEIGFITIYINDKPASYLPMYDDGCIIYFADPGINIISASFYEKGVLTIQSKEGESVYISCIFKLKETSFRKMDAKNGLRDLSLCRLFEKQFTINTDQIKSIALVSTTISRPELPDFPGSDFVGNVNSIMTHIIDYENFIINEIRDFTSNELQKYFKGTILTGELLNSEPVMKELKARYKDVMSFEVGKKSFPVLVSVPDELKPFPSYNNGIAAFFRKRENYESIISDIAASFQVDHVAICNTRLDIHSADDFGTCGTIRLITNFYIFNKDGSILIDNEESWYTRIIITGKDPEPFKNFLDAFPYTLVPILENISYKLSKKLDDH